MDRSGFPVLGSELLGFQIPLAGEIFNRSMICLSKFMTKKSFEEESPF